MRVQRFITSIKSTSLKQNQTSSVRLVHVHARKVQSLRQFVLDRPEAMNALTLPMINTITPQLKVWQDSDLCKVISLSSDSTNAFCAGGDVKTIVTDIAKKNNADTSKALKFFEEEYKLNHLIATTSKPIVAFMDGITMGGGVGLSVHAPFRVVTERTVFAMPETRIGLFPDVGGSFFLPRLDGELGTFLGLTGTVLKGEEVLIGGIGTHFVPSDRIQALMKRLSELETDDLQIVNSCLEEFSVLIPSEKFRSWSLGGDNGKAIQRCFQFNEFEEIVEALAKDENKEWANHQLKVLKSCSPTALRVTLELQRRGRDLDIAKCFVMEYETIKKMATHPDFVNGVTARLISKPRTEPVWQTQWDEAMKSITRAVVEKEFFSSNDKPTHFGLRLISNKTYYDYPHRSLSGLPTLKDVERVIKGEWGQYLPSLRTKKDVLEWFAHNWGHYDGNMIGDVKNAKLTRNLSVSGRRVGHERIGLRQKLSVILEDHVHESESGLVWIA